MAKARLTLAQQLAHCQQVAHLVRARLPIAGALASMSEESAGSIIESAESIDAQLAAGKSLTDALAGDGSRESQVLAACIEAGQRSGRLEQLLESWTDLHLACARYSKRLRSALVYPGLLILITLLSLGYVVWRLIPEYRTTYALFSAELPAWLESLVIVRERFGLFSISLVAFMLLPVAYWFWRRRGFDVQGLPRESARKLRVQALATDLLRVGISSSLPLAQLVRWGVLASGADPTEAERAFGLIQNQRPVPQLARETSMLLASLHAGLISSDEAIEHLLSVADYLRQQADAVAARSARWLPMLVALTVGLLTILTYVGLIYLPWVLLLQRIVSTS